MEKKSQPKNPRSSHPFDTHTHSQQRFFSRFSSNISSASVSTIAFGRQIPKPQGLSLKWQSKLPPLFRILCFFTAYSMNFFSSQYLYLSMLALLSGLLHYSQMFIWMPQHICFKHCTKVCSEAFASKGAHLCSELSKACMTPAQGSRD